MRKLLLVALLVSIAALDWAALHDILKGTEADYRQEWAVLGLSLLIFFFVLRGKLWQPRSGKASA